MKTGLTSTGLICALVSYIQILPYSFNELFLVPNQMMFSRSICGLVFILWFLIQSVIIEVCFFYFIYWLFSDHSWFLLCFYLHTESAVIFLPSACETSCHSLILPFHTVTVLWTVQGCCYHGDRQGFRLRLYSDRHKDATRMKLNQMA